MQNFFLCDNILFATRTNVFITKTNGESMTEKDKYYLVREKAVPEVLLKVIEAKRLLDSGKAATVQDATEQLDISRSSPD